MLTQFSRIRPKDFQRLTGLNSYHSAWRQLYAIADSMELNEVLVTHLAKYWGVDSKDIIFSLLSK